MFSKMMLTDLDFNELTTLISCLAPSSAEDDVSGYIRIHEHGSCQYSKDTIGNSFLTLSGGITPPVLIAAHADEIGLQVVHITKEGFIRFRPVGGVDTKAIVGTSVYIFGPNRRVPGVICKIPVHIELKEKDDHPLEVSDLWIDIGCLDGREAEEIVSVGDMIAFAPSVLRLGQSRLSAKSLDNKLGVFIAVSAMKRLEQMGFERDVVAVFTAQEEVGCKGAAVAALNMHPKWTICLDVGVATDCPGINVEKYGSLQLGRGPALVYCTDSSRQLTDQAASILKKKGIPFQKSVGLSTTGGTDAFRMQITGRGAPGLILSVPIRAMHTPAEVCDLGDVSSAIDAVVELVKSISYEGAIYDK